MPPLTHDSWKLWFAALHENEAGNQNMAAFTGAMDAGKSELEKIKNLTDNSNNVFLHADGNRKIRCLHSPKNFGGTLLRPTHKVASLTGIGRSAICIQINVALAVAECKINTPTREELAACATAQNVRDIPFPDEAPDENGLFSYEGANIMMPAPWLRDTLFNSESNDPFDLIPIVITAALAYDTAHPELPDENKAIVHADDFCSWAWGVGANRVPETRVEINADDGELESYRIIRHRDCITSNVAGTTIEEAPTEPNADVLKQLAASIARQTEESATSNQLRKDEINRKKEHDDDKKDRTKKFIHPSIIRMLKNASATSKMDLDPELPESCKKFLNSSNQGHAEQELCHQFESLNLSDVCFAPGTIQNLFLGEFVYGNSSSPSNFTVFAFYEQPPLSDEKQSNYLICHLIHEKGTKQSVDDIKQSMKQEVIVPWDFNTMGAQLQYFVAAAEIFFGPESLLRLELHKLLHTVAKYKKNFRDAIVLDEFFATKFLFAVDRRVQLFLSSCKTEDSRYHVNDKFLDFNDIIESILFGTFQMILPPTFKKVIADESGTKRESDDTAKAGGKKQKTGEDKKKSVLVKNDSQHEAFKLKEGEIWKKKFKSAFVDNRPTWDGEKTKKMCTRFHILGNCFDNCDRKESHVPKDQIPAAKVAEMCAFIAKCRGE